MKDRRALLGLILPISAGLLFGGCAEAPFGLARLNPKLMKEWEKDAKFGPNMHTKTEELQQLAAAAPSMRPAEQHQLAAELTQMLRDEKNPMLARQMVQTLGAFPTEDAVLGLQAASEHSDADVRAATCEAWRRQGGQAGLDGLVKILSSDTDVDVRIAAARELSHFRKQAAVDALGTALDDPNPALQYRCVQSLKDITDRDLGDNVAAWRQYVAGGEAKASETVSLSQQLRKLF